MLYNDSNNWQNFIKHVLYWEGGTSRSPKDTTAAKCVEAGQIHTNKGVTYCTFKDRADKLGISPVTYERFLNLTAEDSAKFLYTFYNSVNASKFSDSLGLALTEAGWMSGSDRAFKHLYDALKNLGQDAKNKTEAIEKSKLLPEKMLFDEYVKVRRAYLNFLTSSPKYAPFKNGWNNRLKSFYDNFNPETLSGKKKLVAGLLILPVLLIGYLIFKK